ncbi:MAG: phage BR0599 family protein [Opitutae bacterium]|nr:phage BR0599 family protein [Opitutae bacterium]
MARIARTVFLGADLVLFMPDPNWRWSVEVVHRKETYVDDGKTGRENRRPRRFTMLHEIAATWQLEPADTAALETQLADLSVPTTGDRVFVGVPMCMDQLAKARWGERIYDAQWVLNYDETGYAIHAANAVPAVPVRRWLAPLMVGHLQERPALKASTDRRAQFSLRLLEKSPWDYRITPAAEGVVSADFPASLQAAANWKELPQSSTTEIMVYEDLGDGRMEAADGQEDITRRTQQFLVTLKSRAEIRTLLNFFVARKGRMQSFAAPWLLRPGADTPATPHTTKARFAEDALKLTYATDATAHAKIGFIQLPWEIAGVAGEQPEQAARAFLYKLSLDVPGGPIEWRFTNWETDLLRPGDGAYLGDVNGQWEHDKITQTIDLSDEPVTLTSWILTDNPLIRVVQRLVDVPLEILIDECDPENPAGAVQVYEGEIESVSVKSRKLTASTLVLGGRLAAKVPNFFFGPECNHEFCDAGCQLAAAAWTFAGTVVSQVGNVLTLAVTSNPPGAVLGADWFAKGWVSKGAGGAYELKQIVRSADLGGGQQTFTLQRPFAAVAAGDVLTFMPYCGGTGAECETKFGNYLNFGGHPHIAGRNLSIPRRETTPTAGKK